MFSFFTDTKNFLILILVAMLLVSGIKLYSTTVHLNDLQLKYNNVVVANSIVQAQVEAAQSDMYELEKQLQTQQANDAKKLQDFMAQDWSKISCKRATEKVIQLASSFNWNSNIP